MTVMSPMLSKALMVSHSSQCDPLEDNNCKTHSSTFTLTLSTHSLPHEDFTLAGQVYQHPPKDMLQPISAFYTFIYQSERTTPSMNNLPPLFPSGLLSITLALQRNSLSLVLGSSCKYTDCDDKWEVEWIPAKPDFTVFNIN